MKRPAHCRLLFALLAIVAIGQRASGESGPSVPAVFIRHAWYQGRLEEDHLVGDVGHWTIETRQTLPAFLPIDTSLTISSPRWLPTPEVSRRLAAALFGWEPFPSQAATDSAAGFASLGLASRGDQCLEVDRSGTLAFDWSAVARRDRLGRLSFALELPAAASSAFELVLPNDLVPLADHGIVKRLAGDDASELRWQISLGSAASVVLTLASKTAHDVAVNGVVSQSVYDISERGVEIQQSFESDGRFGPLETVRLIVDSRISVLAVSDTDGPLNWAEVETPGANDRVIAVRLPATGDGRKQIVRIDGIAAPVDEGLHRLPAIRAAGLFWKQGGVRCQIHAPLRLDRLELAGGRQNAAKPLLPPLAGEAIECELFAEDASLAVALATRRSQVALSTATNLIVGENDLRARLAVRGQAKGAAINRLSGRLSPGWEIESIDEIGARHGIAPDAKPASADYALLFESPIRDGESFEFRIMARRARWRMPEGLRAGDLEPIVFAARPGRRLVSIQPPTSAKGVANPDVRWLPANQLDDPTRAAFVDPPSAFLLDLGAIEGDSVLTFVAEATRPKASAAVTALVSNSSIDEIVRLRLQPQSAAIERVVVDVSATDAPLAWHGSDPNAFAIAARKLPAPEQNAAIERWELTLSKAQVEPFEIIGSGSRPVASPATLTLIDVPEADFQSGALQVSSERAAPFEVSTDRLELATPVAPEVPGELLSSYRYGHDDFISGARAELRAILRPNLPVAIAWRSRLQSQYLADGRGRHQLTLDVENRGLDELKLSLAPGSRIIGYAVDGVTAVAPADALARIPLLPSVRWTVVRIDLETRDANGLSDPLTAPFPTLDASCAELDRDWSIELPAGYAASSSARTVGISERLLGRLAVAPSARWRPWLRSSWQDLLGAGQQRRARQVALAGERALGDRPAAWGQFCGAWSRELARQQLRCKLQPADLVGAGVGSDTALAAIDKAGSPSLDAFLDRAGLVALVADGNVLLTSRRVARGAYGERAAGAAVLSVSVEELSPLLAGAVEPKDWPALADSPWPQPASGAVAAANVVDLRDLSEGPISIDIVNRSRRALWQAALALGSMCLSMWLARFNRLWSLATLCFAFALALALPASYADFGPAVFLGAGAGCTLALIGQRQAGPVESEAPQQPRPSTRRFVQPVTALLMVAILLAAQVARAQQRPGEFDADGIEWTLAAGRYKGRLEWDAAHQRLLLREFAVVYDLRTLKRDCRVQLPNWDVNRFDRLELRLDGVPVEIEAAAAPDLVFTVAAPGHYRLSVAGDPKLTSAARRSLLELPIPPVADSQVELALPPDAPTPRMGEAPGFVERRDQRRTAFAPLGPAKRLRIDWSPEEPTSPDAPVDVQEMSWLTVRPGNVLLETRFRFDKPAGLTELRVAADPHLRLVAEPGDRDAPEVVAVDAQAQTALFRLPAEKSGPTELTARWQVLDATGAGRQRMPTARAVAANVSRRWAAVSVDLALEASLLTTALPGELTIAEFQDAWGKTDEAPQFVAPLDSGVVDWGVATRPKPARPRIEAQLALTAGAKRYELVYEAAFKSMPAPLFQLELATSPEVAIDGVSLKRGDVEQQSQWTQTDDRTVVRLAEPLAADSRLVVLAHVEARPGGPRPLPVLRLADADETKRTVTLLRRPAVLVRATDLRNLAADTLATTGAEGSDSIAVARYVATQADFAASLIVEPNHPRLTATQLISLEPASQGWQARLDAHYVVAAGEVTALRFRLPAGAVGFKALAGESVATETLPDGERLLIVRLPAGAGRSIRLQLEGQLTVDREAVLAPTFAPLEAAQVESYLALPNSAGGRRLRWRRSQLRPAELPAEMRPRVAGEYRHLRVLNDREPIVLQESMPPGEITLLGAAVDIERLSGWRFAGAATYDVDPRGHDHVVARIPSGYELKQAQVEGRSALWRSLADGRIEISLASTTVPQRVRLTFLGFETGRRRKFNLERPTLEVAGDEPCRWRVWDAAQSPRWHADPSARFAYWRGRLESIKRMVQRTSQVADAAGAANVLAWTARAREAERSATRAALNMSEGDKSALAALTRSIERDIAAMRERAGVNEQATSASTMFIADESLVDSRFDNDAWHAQTAVTETLLPLPKRELGLAPVVLRSALALLGLTLGAVVLRWSPAAAALEAVGRRPQWIVLSVGSLWWLLLSPSFVGFLLIVASLASLAGQALARSRRPSAVAEGRFSVA